MAKFIRPEKKIISLEFDNDLIYDLEINDEVYDAFMKFDEKNVSTNDFQQMKEVGIEFIEDILGEDALDEIFGDYVSFDDVIALTSFIASEITANLDNLVPETKPPRRDPKKPKRKGSAKKRGKK